MNEYRHQDDFNTRLNPSTKDVLQICIPIAVGYFFLLLGAIAVYVANVVLHLNSAAFFLAYPISIFNCMLFGWLSYWLIEVILSKY